MNLIKDLTDQQFGRLIAKSLSETKRHKETKRSFAFWNCECECGEKIIVSSNRLLRGSTRSCGCLQREQAAERMRKTGSDAYAWKGGAKKSRGYIYRYAPEHPYARQKYVMEHRLVMEQKLGRYLFPDETVHHINGVRNDNRLENLELWSKSHPAGQRVEDLLEWAMEIMSRYLLYEKELEG